MNMPGSRQRLWVACLMLLLTGGLSTAAWAQSAAAEPATASIGPKAPFKVLFDNDTTNLLSCLSPYHKSGQPFDQAMLEASVDETADTGVDVHLLQPGMAQVPWWKSRSLPAAEHYAWWTKQYGGKPDSFARFLLGGGDIVDIFVNRSRQKKLAPFISLRLNDVHHLEDVDAKPGAASASSQHSVTKFYVDHLHDRIGGQDRAKFNSYQRGLNWTVPAVRQRMLTYVEEICSGYEISGLELDFLRFCSLFPPQTTTSQQRREIVTKFVGQVRSQLDRTTAAEGHRWLCVRIPCYLAAHDALGIDVQALADAGVDMFNLSAYYFTAQQHDAAAIKRLLPDRAVYLEMTHATYNGPVVAQVRYDNFSFRRTTIEQFYTTAHLAYARGLDGMSTFNFVYYRQHGSPERGPFNEPPFEMFRHLGDSKWLAQQPQHYFLAQVTDDPPVPDRQLGSPNRPKKLAPGQPLAVQLDLAPPQGGWTTPGKLRVQSKADFGSGKLLATLNGKRLESTDDLAEPYANPYSPLLGTPQTLRGWTVPAERLKDGSNVMEIQMLDGQPAEIVFLDLAIR